MQDLGDSPPMNGNGLHDLFMSMVLDYKTLMTGVKASVLGKVQAEITIAGMKQHEKEIPDIIQLKLREAEDHLLQPSNSCGDQSNQICHLFLGSVVAKKFFELPYELLFNDGSNLKIHLNENKDQLVRFELDRALTPDTIIKHPDVRTLADLNSKIKEGDCAQFQNRIVFLKNTFCYVGISNQVMPLQSSPEDIKQLIEFYNAMVSSEPKLIVIDDPYELEEPIDDEDLMFSKLSQIARKQIAFIDFGWYSTHSFTVFIPKTFDPRDRHPHMYQAFFGKHTLQQWLTGSKYAELLQETPMSLIERFAKLTRINRNRSEVKKQEISLFTLGGSDERRALTNPLVRGALSVRLKFKVVEVDVQLASRNLLELQNFINQSYPAPSRSEQVSLYFIEAKKAMSEALVALFGIEEQQLHSESESTFQISNSR